MNARIAYEKIAGSSMEVDWVRRERHRCNGFVAICKKREVQAFWLILSSDNFVNYLAMEEPDRLSALLNLRHPSPLDRSLTKRAWEHAQQEWRRDLRMLVEFRL